MIKLSAIFSSEDAALRPRPASASGGRALLATLILVLLVGTVSGCYSPTKRVGGKLNELGFQWQTNVVHQIAVPDRVLDWPQALAQLEAGNLKLRHARVDITNSHDNVRQAFKDLIPALNVRAGVSKSITSLPATTISDVNFNLDSFFNIPGFVNFGARLFAARLTELRSKTYYELAQREQTIDLYKLFLEFEDANADQRQIDEETALAKAVEKVDSLAGQVLLRDLKSRVIALGRERDALQDKAGDLFGNRDFHWTFVNRSLPQLHYEENPLQLSDTNNVARLQLKLASIEIVAAWARLKGIQLQYWPELTLFITSPPLYQHSGFSDGFWNIQQVRASANVFWRIDLQGQIANQVRQTRRDQELRMDELREEGLALIAKILVAQKLMGTLRDEVKQLGALLPFVAQAPAAVDYAGILKTTEVVRSLRDQERKLRREVDELNTLFWFVDETKWTHLQ